MRIYFTSDIHGSDVCFRKFLNAGKFYGANVLILGGDITGKLLVPVINQLGVYYAYFQDKKYSFNSNKEFYNFKAMVMNCGYYLEYFSENELPSIIDDQEKIGKIFQSAMKKQIISWMKLAESRLSNSNIGCFIMLGNDDSPEISDLLSHSTTVTNPDGERVIFKDGTEMIGLGYSNFTPFNSPREISEGELANKISKLVSLLRNPANAIFAFHVPPFQSGIDMAPELDENLKIRSYGGQPKYIPIGSSAVRDAIFSYQPLLGLHGHVHESRGAVYINETLCINPGSSFSSGILQGAIIDIKDHHITSYQLVSG